MFNVYVFAYLEDWFPLLYAWTPRITGLVVISVKTDEVRNFADESQF